MDRSLYSEALCEREHGIGGCVLEMKGVGIVVRIAGVFDGDRMGRRILPIEESGQPENPVAVGASRIATKGEGEALECCFLALEVEAFDSPENLILAGRCGEDRRWCRDGIRGAERSDTRLPVEVDV